MILNFVQKSSLVLFVLFFTHISESSLQKELNSDKFVINNNADNYEKKVNNLEFSENWIRYPASTAKNTAAYFKLKNLSNQDLKILSARTENISEKTEIHGYKPDDNGVMRMYPLKTITIPANSIIEFKPGSTHVMIMGIKEKIELGKEYKIYFNVAPVSSTKKDDNIEEYNVTFPVKTNNNNWS